MAIDLEKSGLFTAGQCDNFASVLVKSRSSSAFSSELKDFIAPVPKHVANCGISLDKLVNGGDHATLAEALVVHSLDALTYTVVITNVGRIPLTISALSDSLYSAFPASCSQQVGSVLAAGASFTCTYQMAADGDRHNMAAVTAVDVTNHPFSAQDGTFVEMISPATTVKPAVPHHDVLRPEPAVPETEVLGLELTRPATLPVTGFPIGNVALFAGVLVILGYTLRRNLKRRSSSST